MGLKPWERSVGNAMHITCAQEQIRNAAKQNAGIDQEEGRKCLKETCNRIESVWCSNNTNGENLESRSGLNSEVRLGISVAKKERNVMRTG